MKTCACCGQSRKPDGRPIVKVDDALLALCNEAYANAEARSSGDVLIVDLVWCVARSPRWAAEIDANGILPERLAAAAEVAMMRRVARGRDTGPISTCADLKTLLQRAEQRALDSGRPAADVSDFLHALFYEAGDLEGADFVRQGSGVTSRFETINRTWENPPPQRSSAYSDLRSRESFSARSAAFVSPRESATAPPADWETQSRRGTLAAQEHQYADLRCKSEALAHQVQSLSARFARMSEIEHRTERSRAETDAWLEARLNARLAARSGVETALRSEVANLSRRLETQDRQIAELQRLADALAHQSATMTARLSQATELGRAQGEILAGLQRQLQESATERSDGGERRRFGDGAARSRWRRSRRRGLRLRLRQRRRMRMRDRTSRSWSDRTGRPQGGRVGRDTMHAVPRLTYDPSQADPIDAVPRPYLEHRQVWHPAETIFERELEDDIAEPIEDGDDFEIEGAFGERPKRFYLALDDEVERAPSIGPRTAERLTAQGVATVRDLLLCNPRDIASRVQSRYVSAERVAAWKSQARLVCTVPWLRGTHAQLLVGAGYDTLDKLQQASTSDVCAGIARFSETREGQSVLRSGPPPAPERVAAWMGHIALAEPERARLAGLGTIYRL